MKILAFHCHVPRSVSDFVVLAKVMMLVSWSNDYRSMLFESYQPGRVNVLLNNFFSVLETSFRKVTDYYGVIKRDLKIRVLHLLCQCFFFCSGFTRSIEAKQVLTAGFDYITEKNGIMLFIRPKRFRGINAGNAV